MAYLDGVLVGFVCGLAAGIFLAYKIAQRANSKQKVFRKEYEPTREYEKVEVFDRKRLK